MCVCGLRVSVLVCACVSVACVCAIVFVSFHVCIFVRCVFLCNMCPLRLCACVVFVCFYGVRVSVCVCV